MALTDLTRISTSGIATGTSLSGAILHGDAHFRGTQVGVTSALFDSSDNALEFNDDVKLKFGNSGDLQLYHDTDHSYIEDTGTGNLLIKSDSVISIRGTTVAIKSADNSQVLIKGVENAGSELYFNNNLKFITTNHGAVVTGILTATGFSGPTNNTSGIATFYDLRVSNNLTVEGTTTTLDTNLIGVDRVEVGANSNSVVGVAITQSGTADIVNLFDGASQVVTIDDVGQVGLGTAIPGEALHLGDNKKIALGYGEDIQLYHTGSTGYINNSTGILKITGASGQKIDFIDGSGSNYYARFNSGGSVELHYVGGGSKVRTESYGAIVNGELRLTTGGNGYTFITDPDTGMHNPYNGGLHFKVNGTDRISMDSSGISTFHNSRLHIEGAGSGNTPLTINSDNATNNSVHPLIEAYADNSSRKARIGLVREASSAALGWGFFTNANTADPEERLRITSDGRVGIGITDPNSTWKTHIRSSTFGLLRLETTLTGADAPYLELYHNSTSPADNDELGVIQFKGKNTNSDDHTYAYMMVKSTDVSDGSEDGDILFATAGGGVTNERLRIKSNGEIRIISTGNNNDPAHLRLHHNDTSIAANDAIGTIRFAGRDSGGADVSRTGALIQATASNDWDTGQTTGYSATHLDFFTQNQSGTDTVAAGARVRITSGGEFLVGATSSSGARGIIQQNSSDTNPLDQATSADSSGLRLQNYSFGVGRYTALSMECANSSTVQSASIIAQSVSSGQAPDIIIAQRTSNSANAERLRITSTGQVLLGAGAIATPKASVGGLDVASGLYSIIMGGEANTGDGTPRANSAQKEARLAMPHYTNAQEPFGLVYGVTLSGENRLNLGGGSSIVNAATSIKFYTAANTTTTSGTERLGISDDGTLSKYLNSSTVQAAFGGTGQVNGITGLPSMAGTPFVVGRDTGSTRSAHFAGHLKFNAGYGIEFSGGTPNAGSNPTVNSAIFDDYEEGKFEPKFLENATTESNYAWRYGSYVKVGGIVHIRLAFGLNSFQGNFTTGWIGGMPYTAAPPWGTSDFAYIKLIGYSYASGYGDSGNTTGLYLELSQNADKFRVVEGQGKGNVNQSSIGTGQRIAVTFSYPVA